MVTRVWKVYGMFDGEQQHRQKESFNPSKTWDFSEGKDVRIIDVANADRTGTNDYSIVTITRNTAEECEDELNGQISDGLFENYRTGKIEEIKYSIKCSGHHYVTLNYDGKFIFCLDNSLYKAEEIIYQIEKRTQMNFQDIPIEGIKDDFQGLCFFTGGWKRDFWNEFPSKRDIQVYMNLKEGRV